MAITARQLHNMATVLANRAHTRYWLHFNYPQTKPWLMAISCLDHNGEPKEFDASSNPPDEVRYENLIFYVWERSDPPEELL